MFLGHKRDARLAELRIRLSLLRDSALIGLSFYLRSFVLFQPRGVERSNLALNHGRRERKFWMQRRSAKNRHSNARTPAETKIRELSGRKSRQKRAIRRRAGNVRFAETGWWWAQSYANPSPSNSLLNRERTGKFLLF